jgi:hypothetical protein
MTYATSNAIWVMAPWLHILRPRATICFHYVDNTTDKSQEEIG